VKRLEVSGQKTEVRIGNDQREDAKGKLKSEIRNKFKMMKNSKFQTNSIRIRCFEFSEFAISLTAFVSSFDIRISEFDRSYNHG